MKKTIRLAALLCCLTLLLGAVLPEAFLCAYTKHDCTGAHCAVCVQLSQAKGRLEQLRHTPSLAASFAGLPLLLWLAAPTLSVHRRAGAVSLVTLKIQMNN